MEVKVLGPNEYDALKETPSGEVFTPDNCIALVAIEGEEVVGRMTLMNLIHLEGSWIKDGHRNSQTLRALEQAIYAEAKRLGLTYIHSYAPTPAHETMLQRSGWSRMPLSVWVKDLQEV